MAFQPGVNAIDQLYVLGSPLRTNIRDALTKADFSTSTDSITQVELEFVDPDFKLLNDNAVKPGLRVDFIGYNLEISAVETAGTGNIEKVSLKCRPLIYRKLQNRRGPKVMQGVSASQFVIEECKAVGADYLVQPSAVRSQVSRDVPVGNTEGQKPPSSWTTFQRLANEIGFLCFEAGNKVYFGKPSWLIKNVGNTVLAGYKTGAEDKRIRNVPKCSYSLDDPYGTTLSMEVDLSRAVELQPGRRLTFSGIPIFAADYMISSVQYDLLAVDPIAEIDARKPTDPIINTSPVVLGGSGFVRRNTRSSEDFVYWAFQQMGKPYIFGVEVALTDPSPRAFDCSELVQWATAQVGVYIPDGSENQMNYCTSRLGTISMTEAARTRGALLWHHGHIAISLGNGKTVEAANERVGVISGSIGNRFTKAFKIPNMIY